MEHHPSRWTANLFKIDSELLIASTASKDYYLISRAKLLERHLSQYFMAY